MVNQRKPFEGVLNIIRFNWPKYITVLLVCLFATVVSFSSIIPQLLKNLIFLGVALALFSMFVSLIVSFYVYDSSELYQLHSVGDLNGKKVLNINAGFDEISPILKNKFPKLQLTIADFYDAERHTEKSIKRARKSYPLHEGTIVVQSRSIPFPDQSFDKILCVFSAHEIRSKDERVQFLKELSRLLPQSGELIITEHLRDLPNFLAYNIGFFHFYGKRTWLDCFEQAGLYLHQEVKTTAFVSTFILKSHGNTY